MVPFGGGCAAGGTASPPSTGCQTFFTLYFKQQDHVAGTKAKATTKISRIINGAESIQLNALR